MMMEEWRLHSTVIIIIDSNITDSIIMEVVNVWQEKTRRKNGPSRNFSVILIFLRKFLVQN